MILMTDKQRSNRWKMFFTVITLIALVGLAYIVKDQLVITFKNLKSVNLLFVLLVIPLEGLNHLSQGKLYQGMFRILGERFRTRSMVRLSLELNFINSVFPSGGVSGFSYLSIRLKSEKISTGQATLVQLMRFILIFVAFQVLLFIGLVALAIGGQANDFIILIAGSLATLLLFGTMLLAFIVGSKSRINIFFGFVTKVINRVVRFFHSKSPEVINVEQAKKTFTELHDNYMHIRRNLKVLKMPLVYALFASLTEILAIYVVYLAFGYTPNPGAIILAFAVANFAGLVSILPGGVGIYEGLMTAVLVAGGIPAAISLPVTIMYRIVNMSAQLPPGYYFYQRNLHAKNPAEEEIESIKHEA